MVERTRSYWNPLMEPYIYGTRDDIHIFDLEQTVWIGSIHVLQKLGAS
jgi:ribosomal protein S2